MEIRFGYLWEEDGYKVIYNGAVEGSFDGGIDLICYRDNECCLIQCKRWKNNVGAEYIERFNKVVERFDLYHEGYRNVIGFFYTTSDYTEDAYETAEWCDIKCCVEEFDSILDYPPVKCLVRNGEKVYYLPFDKEFDKINVENGCDYKFKIADAERAGYHYHLNSNVILKAPPPVSPPKIQKTVTVSKTSTSASLSKTPTPVSLPKVPPSPMIDSYWNGDKNFTVGFYHSGFAEFVDLKSCKIISYKEDETGGAYILSARYIKISPLQKGYKENTRIFRYYKNLPILPEVQLIGRWVTIPKHDEKSKRIALDFPLSYIENYLPYESAMFKIVHLKVFGTEYTDDFNSLKSSKIIEPPNFQVEKNIPYWNGNKNYPVCYFHAGYFEFVDLKSCRLLTRYTDSEIKSEAYIIQASFICISQFRHENPKENIRVFRCFKDFSILPEVYVNNRYMPIPKYRELKTGEGYLSYIENQKLYSYMMFKIVYYKLFSKEYTDTCKYGWHYEKGYPEYR